jgi:hypothetical protein
VGLVHKEPHNDGVNVVIEQPNRQKPRQQLTQQTVGVVAPISRQGVGVHIRVVHFVRFVEEAVLGAMTPAQTHSRAELEAEGEERGKECID